MLEELIQTKKITREEAEIYMLFNINEVGRKWMDYMIMDTFMDCVPPQMFTAEIFAYSDGRRSIFRDIKVVIDFVKKTLAEETYD